MMRDSAPDDRPEANEPQPDSARRSARKLIRELDGPVDEDFKQSLAGLSRRLGERVASQATSDPRTTAEARKAALQAYDLDQARRAKALFKTVGVVGLTIGVAAVVVMIADPFDRPLPRASAPVKPIEVAAVPPLPLASPANNPAAVPPPVAPAPVQPAAPAPVQMPADPPASVEQASTESRLEPSPAPLQPDEVKEVQTKLHGFGFNPGPLDGVNGRMTRAAVMHYQLSREQVQTGEVDRLLLEQLREDPAPQVAPPPQAAQRTTRPARPARAPRVPDPFEPLRTAAQDFERWLQSIGR